MMISQGSTSQRPTPVPEPRSSARTGQLSWAMGFLACLPIPIVNTLVAGVVMMCVYPATAHKGPPQAAENARNAANWGLTVVVGTVAIVAYMLAMAHANLIHGFLPLGWGVIGYVALCISHLSVTIAGTARSGRRVFRSVVAIPLFRRPKDPSIARPAERPNFRARPAERPDFRARLSPQQTVDQAVLDEASARRAQGERVKALRGVTDGKLRIYTRAEAGPAWSESSSSRAVYSVVGISALVAIESAILIIFIIAMVGSDNDDRGGFVVGIVICGTVWLASAMVLTSAARAKLLRRKRGLPDPVQGSGHLFKA